MRAYAFLWVMTLLFFLSGGAADQIATSIANLSSNDTWLKFLVSLLLFCLCWMATMLSLWINPHMDVGQCAYAAACLFSLQSSTYSTARVPNSAVAFSTFQFIGMSLTAGFGSSAMGFLTDLATSSNTLKLIIHSVLYLTFAFGSIAFTVLGLPQTLHEELAPPVEQNIGIVERWARKLSSYLLNISFPKQEEEEEEKDDDDEYQLIPASDKRRRVRRTKSQASDQSL